MSKFFHHLDLPPLDNFFIQEALTSKFEIIKKPSALNRADSSFFRTNFSKLIDTTFGKCGSSFHKHPANAIYDWHVDYNRSCALIWVIQTNPKATTLYREAIPDAKLMYNITEVDYTIGKPTLLNTTYEHCVINNSNTDRITLNMSIFDTSYEQALEFFQNLKIKDYSLS
jgi:hypothetical protein